MDDKYKQPVNDKKVKFRQNILGSRRENARWIIIIIAVSFFLSASMQFISSGILDVTDNVTALCVVFVIIVIGIVFDIIGIAVTAADEVPFHAMASRKLYGAKRAIRLVRNANKVSSLCNDVVGDICGVISGTASALIVLRMSHGKSLSETTIIGLVISGMVAATTIGGKAIGKTFAISNSNYIVYKVSVLIQFITVKTRIGHNKRVSSNKHRKHDKLKER